MELSYEEIKEMADNDVLPENAVYFIKQEGMRNWLETESIEAFLKGKAAFAYVYRILFTEPNFKPAGWFVQLKYAGIVFRTRGFHDEDTAKSCAKQWREQFDYHIQDGKDSKWTIELKQVMESK